MCVGEALGTLVTLAKHGLSFSLVLTTLAELLWSVVEREAREGVAQISEAFCERSPLYALTYW